MLMYYENIFQFLAFLCGLITWRSIRPRFLRLVILLLALTVINEILIIPHLTDAHRNMDYNIFSFFDMGVWLLFYQRVHAGKPIGRMIIPAALIIYLYTCWEISHRGWAVLHTDSFRLYNILILLLAYAYLYSILRKEYHVLTVDPLFWVSAACIIYQAVLFLIFTTLAEKKYWYFTDSRYVFDILMVIGNIFYYLFLSFSFIACFNSRSRTSKTDSCPD